MSIYVTSHVWNHSSLKGTALLLVLALADQANDEGIAWPSVATLARKSRLSERTVQNLLPVILGSGEVDMIRDACGPGHPRMYRVLAPLPPHRNGGVKGENSAPIRTAKGADSGTGRVQIPVERVQKSIKRVQHVAPEPYSGTVIKEPGTEPERADARERFLDDGLFRKSCERCGSPLKLRIRSRPSPLDADDFCPKCWTAGQLAVKAAEPHMPMASHGDRDIIAAMPPLNGHANGSARASPDDQAEDVPMFDDQPVPASGSARARRTT